MEEDKIIAAILAAGIVVARGNGPQTPFSGMLHSPPGAVDTYRKCLAELRKPETD